MAWNWILWQLAVPRATQYLNAPLLSLLSSPESFLKDAATNPETGGAGDASDVRSHPLPAHICAQSNNW